MACVQRMQRMQATAGNHRIVIGDLSHTQLVSIELLHFQAIGEMTAHNTSTSKTRQQPVRTRLTSGRPCASVAIDEMNTSHRYHSFHFVKLLIYRHRVLVLSHFNSKSGIAFRITKRN